MQDLQPPLAAPLDGGWAERTEPCTPSLELLHGIIGDDARIQALERGIDPSTARATETGLQGLNVLLNDGLRLAPTSELIDRWRRQELIDPIADDAARVAADVGRARASGVELRSIHDMSGHSEALDFSDPANVERNFFYLADILHRRRVHMLADVVVHLARTALAQRGQATILEIGCGLSSIQRVAAVRLSPSERQAVRFVAIDVSGDLLRYGLSKGWLDTGIEADAAALSAEELFEIEQPDVIIAAEVLEHIRSSAAIVHHGLLQWARSCRAWFVGSVPNAVQLAEMAGLRDGSSSSHQLTRHLFDPSTDHVAFYTYATLRHALTSFWAADQQFIWSNGVRIDQRGTAVALDAGLSFPHLGDRLCFAASFDAARP